MITISQYGINELTLNKKAMEIKINRNIKTNRIVLVDKKTGMAFTSFGKDNKMFEFFMTYHKEEIKDFKPIKL